MDSIKLLERLGTVDPPEETVLANAVARLEAEIALISIEASPAIRSESLVRRSVDRTRRTRRVWQVTSVAAMASLVFALTTLLQTSTPSAGASILRHLARVAAERPVTNLPGPGQYLYVDSDDESLTTTSAAVGAQYSYLQIDHREMWVAANGSGRLIDTPGNPTFLTPTDEAIWRAAGSPAISTAKSDMAFGPDGLSTGPANLSGLPTNPTTLGAEIAQRKIEGGPPGPGEDFIQVGDLLRETRRVAGATVSPFSG